MTVLLEEFGLEALDDRGEANHWTSPQPRVKPSMRVLMLVLGTIGEVGVAGGGEDRVVAEDLLDLDQIDAGLDEVGGVAVTQAVGRDLFFIPQEAMT